MRIYALLNQKGGVGKTATTIGLAGAMAARGYRVLAVDLDPQGHLTAAAGLAATPVGEPGLAEALVDLEHHTPGAAAGLAHPWRPGIDVAVSGVRMAVAERELYRERAAEYRLERLCELWAGLDRWDVALIDCPPTLAILADIALVAADEIIVPALADDPSIRALDLLADQITAARRALRVDVDVTGIVITAYDARRGAVTQTAYDALHERAWPVLATVPERAAVREADRYAVPVVEHAPDSPATAAYGRLLDALTGETETEEAAA